MPIREELSLSSGFYESLDEQEIDVTHERIQEAHMLSQPLDLACGRFEGSASPGKNQQINKS